MIHALWLLLPALTFADCDHLRIQGLQNVDFTNDHTPTENIKVMQQGGECDFFLTVDNGGAPSFNTRRLRHENRVDEIATQICIDASCASSLKHFPEAVSSGDVLSGRFGRGENSKYLDYRPRIQAEEYQRFGHYESGFTMRLYEGTVNGKKSLADTQSFQLKFRMNKRIDLSIVNPGQPFDRGAIAKIMNFGSLRKGDEIPFDLLIKTNAGYQVKLFSLYGGQLRHRSAGVPYTISFGGHSLSLKNEVIVAQGTGASGREGHRFPGRVRIEEVADVPAGYYFDIVTVRVTTTE